MRACFILSLQVLLHLLSWGCLAYETGRIETESTERLYVFQRCKAFRHQRTQTFRLQASVLQSKSYSATPRLSFLERLMEKANEPPRRLFPGGVHLRSLCHPTYHLTSYDIEF